MSTLTTWGAAEDATVRIAQPGESIGESVVGHNLDAGSPVYALIIDVGDDQLAIEGTASHLRNLAEHFVRVANTLPTQ